MRKGGYLMPVASLPGKFGCGDLGTSAYEFIDIMQESGIKLWQILPLNPLGYGNSPYQPYSSLAGDDIYISLEKLIELELLDDVELLEFASDQILYDEVRKFREKYLKLSFERFKESKLINQFNHFIDDNKWVNEYAVYITLKKHNEMKCWVDWPLDQKQWINDKKYDLTPFNDEITYEMYLQFMFFKQWHELKYYANHRGIEIMGDIPIYVGIDSIDVWANQQCFLLDDDGKPTYVAGVPPDYFAVTGQRWGNPIYDWDYIEKDNFKFWIERLRTNLDLFDEIRIDHFRAFDTYWKIPASCPTAIEGEWVEAPGYAMFDRLFEEFPTANIVAEDLGDLRPEVLELRDHYNFKGMKIIQFTFDPNETNNDFADKENMIIYTGTHDNQTINGWFNDQSDEVKLSTIKYLAGLGYHENFASSILEYCFSNIAEVAIVPVQDVLGLDDCGRLNTPGTVGSPNWEWKLSDFEALKKQCLFIKNTLKNNQR